MFDLIPHAEIVLTQIRVNDVWLLLAVGAGVEFVARIVLLGLRVKPKRVVETDLAVQDLSKRVEHLRKMGPSKFVETSKLERQLLAREKERAEARAARKARHAAADRIYKKRLNYLLFALVYAAYYSVPVLTLDALAVPDTVGEFVGADTYLKCLLFPVSAIGIGNKLSRWGIRPATAQASSLSSLMVLWSAQTTVGMVMDAVEAHVLLRGT
jgi:hypothetical protein